jgi:glycosyltransferase involved in cell wall biosynthesis
MNKNGTIQAGPYGYTDGSEGPEFPRRRPAPKHNDWPIWRDRLRSQTSDSALTEGGLRIRGQQMEGTPESPLVSYVTVVRNNAETLARAIESVQRQTYRNVEHIVLDGASTDGTLALIRQYDDRLDYFASESDQGLYDALNKAIPLARGQLICVLNSDDWLESNAAEIAVQRLRDRQDAALLFTAAAVSLPCNDTIVWAPAFVHPGSYFTCANDCHNAIYATRAAYEASGPYDASYKIAADFRWIMSCLDAGARTIYTREVTVNYSLGGVSNDLYAHSMECIRIVRERFPMLLPAEAQGLYHRFFSLHRKVVHLIPNRPSKTNEFISSLLAKYSTSDDFVTSLAWALAGSAVSSRFGVLFAPASDVLEAIKDLLKAALKPAAYALARKLYRMFQKR